MHSRRPLFFIDPSHDLTDNLKATAALLEPLGQASETSPERQRPGGTTHTWKNTRIWHDVSGASVSRFLNQFVTHPAAVKVNSKVLAEFVDKQIERDMLTHWHVALFAGDRPDRHGCGSRPDLLT